ncbi:LutC/YkgG family protein [Paraburkholderia lycopersici]|uniref:L-lactate dehydrogenase complex protein LldG n=1 Tax=Paraburkholderia lycopersici TaxID=416944 RepID=A0A1G7CJ00_9BURK|nr:LUD domain-containing protein [Paraburkholderia lycopersici]SDE38666.1 L-lactate dehydrogenase complex protein LldG [Paraburkholderia lycopersici]
MSADTTGARARMLGRLREHARATAATAVEALDARIDAHFEARRAHAPLALNERIAQFRHMLEAAHAEVICASGATWAADLAQRLEAAGVRNLLLDTSCVEGHALTMALPAHVQARDYARPIEQWKAELFDTIDAGFTVARSGLAATGTLVVAPDANAPRTVSLVPPLHVALIYARTLHADLHAAVTAERWRDGMPANLVMISGPSKTSDIQQTTAYGAHGPRALWVVVVIDEDHETSTQRGAAQ